MALEEVNEQRELLNYEPSHLYNVVKHKGVTLNPVADTSSLNSEAEYGVWVFDDNGKRKRVLKYSSLERCQIESERRPGSIVVRLGRNHRWKSMDVLHTSKSLNIPIGDFLAMTDESGNIETPENPEIENKNVYQLISTELITMGYYRGSRPPAEILRTLAMRYNDIVPEEFAAAVIKHCELPKISDGEDKVQGKSPFKSPEEKEAWYDTPAGMAWVKEHPIPSIFNLPTPEYLHRRG